MVAPLVPPTLTNGSAPNPDAAKNPDVASANAMADIVKLTTSLATGALAFSIGLTTSGSTVYTSGLQTGLICSWVLLSAAVAAGLWTLFYMPSLARGGSFSLNDLAVRLPAMVAQGAFGLGIGALAVVLIRSLSIGPTLPQQRLRTPIQAVTAAVTAIAPRYRVSKVGAVELIKGTDVNKRLDDAWHVQLEAHLATAPRASTLDKSILDVYLDPQSGAWYIPENEPKRSI
jgi:hypothetical protein